MNKKIKNLLHMSLLLNSSEYDELNYIDDMEVNECLTKMYLWLLSGENEESQKLFDAYYNKYEQLDAEQQEIIDKEFWKLTEEKEKKEDKGKQKVLKPKEKV